MSMRGQLSMRASHELSTRKQDGAGSSLFFAAALALVLILLAVASVTFAPAASDPIELDAGWLIGP